MLDYGFALKRVKMLRICTLRLTPRNDARQTTSSLRESQRDSWQSIIKQKLDLTMESLKA
ncbi:hypothetical protein [Helicobacter rodentium]|uniref:hypothetical protein n=1 Tax=Helicobacter rodentium TaxID=59617 RepID=UPI00261A4399|nr:hypothetical protein [Helicobacter rodentium]